MSEVSFSNSQTHNGIDVNCPLNPSERSSVRFAILLGNDKHPLKWSEVSLERFPILEGSESSLEH